MAANFLYGLSSAMTSFNNTRLLEELKEGDLVEFPRNAIYSHWGVYVGNGKIIHLSGEDNDVPGQFDFDTRKSSEQEFNIAGVMYNQACVKKESFLTVAGESNAKINNDRDKDWTPLPPRQIVRRAHGMLGDRNYDVISMNCEHFANYCRYNKVKSDQVDNIATSGALVGVAAIAGLALLDNIWGNKKESEEEKKRKERQRNRSYHY